VIPNTKGLSSISNVVDNGATSILFLAKEFPIPVREKSVKLTVTPLLKEVLVAKLLKVSVLRVPAAALNAVSSVKTVNERALAELEIARVLTRRAITPPHFFGGLHICWF